MSDQTRRTGAERITAERHRQIKKEGWTPEHDDEHDRGELALAAICYAAPCQIYERAEWSRGGTVTFCDPWPASWAEEWDKRPRGVDGRLSWCVDLPARIRMLEKAGALIAAEIDRLLRSVDPEKGGTERE